MNTLRGVSGLVLAVLLVSSSAEAQVEDTPAPQQPYSPIPGDSPAQAAPEFDPFLPPPGMVTPPECLIPGVGFFGHHPFVYSPNNCFDLAVACYKYCYFEDAIALLTHAINQDPQARYYYLRGMAQMKAGFAHDAIQSADGVWEAIAAGLAAGLFETQERFNGPVGVQFQELLHPRNPALRPAVTLNVRESRERQSPATA